MESESESESVGVESFTTLVGSVSTLGSSCCCLSVMFIVLNDYNCFIESFKIHVSFSYSTSSTSFSNCCLIIKMGNDYTIFVSISCFEYRHFMASLLN